MEHHADFAIPVTHHLWIETKVPRPNRDGNIEGWAISIGWWVDPGNTGESTGTLYLVVDSQAGGPPVWIAEGNIVSCHVS